MLNSSQPARFFLIIKMIIKLRSKLKEFKIKNGFFNKLLISLKKLLHCEKNMSFNIGKLGEFPQGSIKEVNIQEKTYAISNIDGMIFAIDGRCTHAGGKLSNGHLVGKTVTCPKHGAQFDVTNGKNLKKPRIPFVKASDLKSYKVTIEDENVIIEI